MFAQILEFKQDEHGNYTGFVIKTFDLISGPVQAIVHYNVTGKQAGYITFGQVQNDPLLINSGAGEGGSGSADGSAGGNFVGGDGAGLVIEGGQVVGGSVGGVSDGSMTNDSDNDSTDNSTGNPTNGTGDTNGGQASADNSGS